MIGGMRTALLFLFLGFAALAQAADEGAFLEVIRARVTLLPALESSVEAGSPKFMVSRFNSPPILAAGERYGAIRVISPADKALSLAWMFSDTTNIDEYGLMSRDGVRLESQFSRFIQPATANADPEQELAGRRASSLPRPWDLFQLHMLGVSARLLKPGTEYIIWFRFSDHRPTDLLLAATFVDPAAKLDAASLPPIFGLPALGVP
jgi:hypothetical protein